MGRPPVEPRFKRKNGILVRLNDDEMDFVTELALEKGVSKSKLFRNMIFEEEKWENRGSEEE